MATSFVNGRFSDYRAIGLSPGAALYTYAATTLNPLATYTDQSGGSSNANPVICDVNGGADVWLGASAYKFRLYSDTIGNGGVLIDEWDNISGTDGFDGALSYVAQTVGARLLAIGADPRSFGALANGSADDTSYINQALLYSKTLDLRNGTWKWTSSIAIPAGPFSIDARGATLVPATGATPCLTHTGAKEGLHIVGGMWAPTSGTFLLQCSGSTNTPTLASHYARQIRLCDMHVTSTALTAVLDFQQAVRQVNISRCMFYAPSGINASGKCVEVMIADSIIYSATGAAGTYGIKLRSTGGTTYYNEGWSITNSTIDNFEISHDITDVFVYQVTGGYTGAIAAGYAFQFQAPSTNLCEELTIGGGAVVAGRIRFAASTGGQAYHANIDALFQGAPGTAVAIENNASNITIRGKWKAGSSSPIGVVGTNNNANIVVSGDFDSTYVNGVVLNGATGANCVVGPLSGPTSGDLFGAGRANIIYHGAPVHSTGTASLTQTFSAANLGGGATYAVGVAISTIAWGFARGESGDIVINLSYSGANAATQNVQIAVPAGMVLASGTGWSAANLYLGSATGLLSVRVPYYCTADGSGNVTVTNQAGNTLTVNNQGYCGVVRGK